MNQPQRMESAIFRRVFAQSIMQATERAKSEGGRFAYYTNAATAAQIIRNGEIWMRSTMMMNDYGEVQHGLECVRAALNTAPGKPLAQAIDACQPNTSELAFGRFKAWVPGFVFDTFVTCVSEHVQSDDMYGRLSMWRAYGGNAGVALVFNGEVMFRESDALGAYSYPVSYADAPGVATEIDEVTALINQNKEILQDVSPEHLANAVFAFLRRLVVCTKHPAFREEREWRVVTSPALEPSAVLKPSIETVGGIPQTVLKIPLQDMPGRDPMGLDIRSLLDRVLIGPTDHAQVVARAMNDQLQKAGIAAPADKIHITGVPLRSRAT